jgi:hypothetical protein
MTEAIVYALIVCLVIALAAVAGFALVVLLQEAIKRLFEL